MITLLKSWITEAGYVSRRGGTIRLKRETAERQGRSVVLKGRGDNLSFLARQLTS